jgi:curli biogenesis system outer membrane secretion channel CsgG
MMIIRLLTAAALAAGALLTAQTASASPATDALLNALNGVGLPISGEAAITAGNLACDSSTSGLARDLIASRVADETGLDPGQANTFAGVALSVYCPLR